MPVRTRALLAVVASALLLTAACGSKAEDTAEPLAAITVTLPGGEAEAGAPLDVAYRFERTKAGPAFSENYVVFVHVLDEHGRLLWTDDHEPAVPTSKWGNTAIEYRRTMFVPRDSAAGRVIVEAGLYSLTSGERVPLAGTPRGNRAYEVASFAVGPPGNNLVVFGDGWHGAEQADGDPSGWRWSKKAAHLSIRNPRRNIVLTVDMDQPVTQTGDQTVEWRVGDELLETTTVTSHRRSVRRIAIPAERLGTGEQVDFELRVSPTFVPASIPSLASQDRRELGVRLFNVHVAVE